MTYRVLTADQPNYLEREWAIEANTAAEAERVALELAPDDSAVIPGETFTLDD